MIPYYDRINRQVNELAGCIEIEMLLHAQDLSAPMLETKNEYISVMVEKCIEEQNDIIEKG